MKFKQKLLLQLFVLVSAGANSQAKIIINGAEGNRKLTWADFSGKPDKSNPYFANTGYYIGYQTSDVKLVGDSISIGKFEVKLELDQKNTWLKKGHESDELLVHEQGHWDIGVLCLREIWSAYQQAKFTRANYNITIQSLVGNAQRKYHEMGMKYDQETKHSMDKEQQAKWNAFLKESLAK